MYMHQMPQILFGLAALPFALLAVEPWWYIHITFQIDYSFFLQMICLSCVYGMASVV